MRIITWNCNMVFRRKAAYILTYHPDILIIPECEHPEKLKFHNDLPKPVDTLWFGTNQNKGLGIFSYTNFKFKLLPCHDPALRTIIPISVTGGSFKFTLFAIWASNPQDKGFQYVGQIWKALHYYDNLLKNKRTILVGDFNSNSIWDKPKREGNHTTVVKHLEKKGIHSCYHTHLKQQQGQEVHPTLYMYRHNNKPYHIDYCFVSKDFAEKLESVEVGDYGLWSRHSDHVPLITTFNM